MTIVPLKLYFNDKGRAKVELALARGKKLHDKRETEKKRSWDRERGRLMRAEGRDTHGAASQARSLRRARLRLGALERVLSRCAGRRGGRSAARVRPTVSATAQLNLHGPGVIRRTGGAAAGAAGQQRSVLRMGRADCRGASRISSAAAWRSRRADAALRRQGRRAPASISAIPTARCWNSCRYRRSAMSHDERPARMIRTCCRTACRCRRTTARRAICRAASCRRVALAATDGAQVDLSKLAGRTVVYIYPRTGVPGQPMPDGWDAIPGRARLHAAVLLVSRSFRRARSARRRASVRAVDPGHATISARRSSACICRFRSCPIDDLAAHPRAQAADLRSRRHDAAQAHGAGDRRRRDHQGVLSGVPAGQEAPRSVIAWLSGVEISAHVLRTPRGTSPASARRYSCCSASSDSCRTASARRSVRCRRAPNGGRRALAAERRAPSLSCAMRPSARSRAVRHFGDRRAEEIAAGLDLGRRRLVLRRHAAHRIGDAARRPASARRRAAPR